MHELLAIFRSLTKNLDQFTLDHGNTTYVIIFAIVFVETGLVIMPFLPGDSLLFAAGAVAARGILNPGLLFVGLIAAAIIGDALNFQVGAAIGPRIMSSEDKATPLHRFFNKKHLQKTHAFFEKHGPKTIILARFVPIVRTFAPFVAGAGAMNYKKFLAYNVVGAVAWVTLMLGAGWTLGQIPFVKERFEVIVIGIVVLSVLPMFVEWVRSRRQPA